jgi:hypothetical protein
VITFALLAVRIGALSTMQTPQALPFSDARWEFRGDSTHVDTVDGRESLRMETGAAIRRDVRLEDGTIDVDVKVTRRRSFVFVGFRIVTDEDHEEFYLRPHKSSLPDAVQYAPVFRNQAAWQLYSGPGATASPTIAPGVWTHLRIVLSGERAAIFWGDTLTPILVVPHLARAPQPGYLSLYAFVPPGTPGSGPIARFANVRISPGAVPYSFAPTPPEKPIPGVIDTWTVGPAFLATDLAPTAIAPAWLTPTSRVHAEARGLVELNRDLPMPEGFGAPGANADVGVVARVRLTSAAAQLVRLDLGFSDVATVFLNGQPLFHGDQSYSFLGRRDGLIGFDQATVYLPLRAGQNELAVFVADGFGGWGLMGRVVGARGVRVAPW